MRLHHRPQAQDVVEGEAVSNPGFLKGQDARIKRYLESLHCTLFARAFDISDDKGKDKAAKWLGQVLEDLGR